MARTAGKTRHVRVVRVAQGTHANECKLSATYMWSGWRKARMSCQWKKKKRQCFSGGCSFLDFVRLTTRTPHGVYARRANRDRIDPHRCEVKRLMARTGRTRWPPSAPPAWRGIWAFNHRKKKVQSHVSGDQFDFVCTPARTEGPLKSLAAVNPGGASVRVHGGKKIKIQENRPESHGSLFGFAERVRACFPCRRAGSCR